MNYINCVTQIANNFIGKLNKPAMCTFVCTWRCNLNCRWCDIGKRSGPELGLDAVRSIFSAQLRCLDLVKITGGEPFLRTDIGEIVGHVREEVRPSMVYITTNGTRTDQIIDFVERFGSSDLMLAISIDGVGERHDFIRNANGAYSRAVSTLKELVALRNQKKFGLKINQTIGPDNIDQLQPLFQAMQALGVQHIDLMPAMDQEPNASIGDPNPKSRVKSLLQPEQLNRFFNEARKQGARYKDFVSGVGTRLFLGGLERLLKTGRRFPNIPCLALNSYFRMLPDGSVPICSYYLSSLGNLSKLSFDEFWTSPKAAKARVLAGKCSGCWAGCEIIPSAAYSGKIAWGLLP